MDKSRRVVITHPRTSTRRRPSRTSAPRDLREHTFRGEVLLAALRRSQLRLAMAIASVFLMAVGGIPVVYASADWVRATRVGPIPLIWLTLGILVFPLVIWLGWLHIRATERYEQQFIDLIEDV
jgi:TRAP-type C4-dicarboxylate transport system permease small subunit